MEVEVRVRIEVRGDDPREFDPDTIRPGDPLEDRVVDSVAEAVSWALKRNADDGFCHDLEELVTLEPGSVEARLVRPDASRVRALVLRSSREETTFAVVSCRRTEEVRRAGQLLALFSAAVTDWVKETDAGKAAYANSSEDYNVGDLSTDIDDDTLQPFLERHGLFDIEIETFSETDFQNDWTYDTHLVADEDLDRDADTPLPIQGEEPDDKTS
jgi:hypothetical protein